MKSVTVTGSHPEAIQISDRFHLVKGLSEVICKYILRAFPAKVEIPDCNDVSREKQHQFATQQKQQEVEEARKLVKEGYPIEQVAIQMNHTYKTIQNYLNPNYSLTNGHYNVRIPGKLAPYEKEVIELRSQGITYPQIHKIISAKGYSGSVASLRMFMQKERARRKEQDEQSNSSSEFIQRKSLCQLIYKRLENVTTISGTQYEKIITTYPQLSELYALVKDFYVTLFSKNPDKLDSWMESAAKHDIPELQTFLTGISKDIKAVKNGILWTYNNGLAEGSVNKIKVIKRIMYGRNSFDLLKSKVLFHELFQSEFN